MTCSTELVIIRYCCIAYDLSLLMQIIRAFKDPFFYYFVTM